MSEQLREKQPFWENNQGVPVPEALKSAAQMGKISEENYKEAIDLLGEANLPRGLRGKVMSKENVERLKTLLQEAGIEQEEINNIFRLCGNI